MGTATAVTPQIPGSAAGRCALAGRWRLQGCDRRPAPPLAAACSRGQAGGLRVYCFWGEGGEGRGQEEARVGWVCRWLLCCNFTFSSFGAQAAEGRWRLPGRGRGRPCLEQLLALGCRQGAAPVTEGWRGREEGCRSGPQGRLVMVFDQLDSALQASVRLFE